MSYTIIDSDDAYIVGDDIEELKILRTKPCSVINISALRLKKLYLNSQLRCNLISIDAKNLELYVDLSTFISDKERLEELQNFVLFNNLKVKFYDTLSEIKNVDSKMNTFCYSDKLIRIRKKIREEREQVMDYSIKTSVVKVYKRIGELMKNSSISEIDLAKGFRTWLSCELFYRKDRVILELIDYLFNESDLRYDGYDLSDMVMRICGYVEYSRNDHLKDILKKTFQSFYEGPGLKICGMGIIANISSIFQYVSRDEVLANIIFRPIELIKESILNIFSAGITGNLSSDIVRKKIFDEFSWIYYQNDEIKGFINENLKVYEEF